MNEKLMEQIYEVLNKYDKSFGDSGVLANLEAWHRNKGWLVELLRRHPNWNEEACAVLFEVTHSREIDRDTVNCYKADLVELINDLALSENAREQFTRALETVAVTYAKILPEADTAVLVKEQCGVSCSVGQKTSRIINAICKRFGVDRHPEYNARFARLADSLNPMQMKRKALLSVHPCDFLEMSNRNNSWSSCHCLDCGEYRGGTLSYMNDGCSILFYTVDEDVTEAFYKAPKRTRQVFCYRDGILLQSRLYPRTDDDEAREMYRNIVQRTIADCLQLPNLWTLKREHQEVDRRVVTHDDALHYRDYQYKSYRPNISLLKGACVGEYDCIVVGNTAYCLECAEPFDESDTTYCERCSDDGYVICEDCGRRVLEDDAHLIRGAFYCDACCSYCMNCEEYTTGDITEVHGRNGEIECVCQTCLEEHYYYCVGCVGYFLESDGFDTQYGFRCNDCLDEDYGVCYECGEYTHHDCMEEIDGTFYCGPCAESARTAMEERENAAECSVSA